MPPPKYGDTSDIRVDNIQLTKEGANLTDYTVSDIKEIEKSPKVKRELPKSVSTGATVNVTIESDVSTPGMGMLEPRTFRRY